jgi:hypothetical protein
MMGSTPVNSDDFTLESLEQHQNVGFGENHAFLLRQPQ